MQFNKERVLTLSIIIVGFLLLSTYQIHSYPMPLPAGELSITQTTPIPQSTNSTVHREPYPSVNSAVILNYTPFSGSEYFQFPRFDYDFIIFNLTIEAKNEETECRIFANIYSGDDLDTTQSISGIRTISLFPNMVSLKNGSERWLVEGYIIISPQDAFICHSLIVWANSSLPLCPVSVDLRSTQGLSLFETSSMNDLRHADPYLTTSKDNLSSSNYRFYPQFVNHTLYLNPSSLNGTCFWENNYHPDLNFTLSFSENQKVTLIVHLRAVRVEVLFDTSYSIHRIVWMVNDNDKLYELHLTPSTTPFYLFVPPVYSSVTFSLSDLFDDSYGSYFLHTLATVQNYTQIDGTYNLQMYVEFRDAANIIQTWDLIYNSLSLILFFLILLRMVIWMNNTQLIPKKQFKVDFRLIPSLLLMILAFIPWFNTIYLYDSFWQDTIIPIQSVYFGPFPLVGIWTEGSAFLLKIPAQAISWALLSIILYWAPLLWCLVTCSTPSNRQNDVLMSLILFIPASHPYLIQSTVAVVASSPVFFSFIPSIGFVVPIAWLMFIGFLSIRGYYNYGRHSNELEYDSKIQQEIKETK